MFLNYYFLNIFFKYFFMFLNIFIYIYIYLFVLFKLLSNAQYTCLRVTYVKDDFFTNLSIKH